MDVDTIASVSTAPGIGAIAVVRVSGPGAASVLARLAPQLAALPEPRVATVVEIRDPETSEALDETVVTRFAGPASYTGEDLVEISCHGGWLVPSMILDACLACGARRAEPGEYTRRAYLHGKLDLIQVEAVADLIEARSKALHRAAMTQLDRGLSALIVDLREALVGLEALLAHHIDFPEEDEPPVSLERIEREAESVVRGLDGILSTAPEGELLREGAVVVLAGRPNVGKSSLYNALLGQERAIVTDEPGTTRDALEATVQLSGFPFRLVDTAGLRETDEQVERLGIEVTHRYLDRADVVLLCVAADEGMSRAEREFVRGVDSAPVVLVETKADLVVSAESKGSAGEDAAAHRALGGPNPREEDGTPEGMDDLAGRVRVSTLSRDGLAALRALLPALVYSGLVNAAADTPVLTRRRHAQALERARVELSAFRTALTDGLPAEVAAAHLHPAKTALEEVLGVISVEDVLDVVFREFCVGK